MLSYFDSITVPGLERITVFRDDEDSAQFYAMPSTPRLARDDKGQLLLDLMIYARDVDKLPVEDLQAQRGWLAASVELAISKEEHEKILAHLREVMASERNVFFWRLFNLQRPNREPKVALPPQFVDGSATLMVPNPGGTTTSLATTKPSLISTNLATIAGDLSQDSSELMRQAVIKGGLPLAANYSLTFLARIPAIKVHINGTHSAFIEETINKYQTTETRWHTYSWNWWWGYYHWMYTWAETYTKTNTSIESHQNDVKSITLKIDATDFRNDPASVEAMKSFEAMAIKIFAENVVPAITRDVGKQLDELKKKLDPTGEAAKDPNKEPFGIKELTGSITETIDITLEKSSVIQVTKNPNGALAKDLTEADIKKAITYLDLSDPYFRELPVRVRANVNFTRDPVYGLKVFLEYDETDDRIPRAVKGSKTMLFTSADQVQSFRQILARASDGSIKDTYKYWSEIIYKDTGQTIRVPATGSTEARDTELVISYRSLGFIQVALTLAPMPENVVSVDVAIRYPRSTLPGSTQRITLSTAKPTASFFTYTGHGGDPDPYRYALTYVLADGQRMDVPEQEERAEQLGIPNPFEDTVDTTFAAAVDWTLVDKVIIDARYSDPANDLNLDHHAELSASSTTSSWRTNLRDPLRLDYTFSTTVLFKNGSTQQDGPNPGTLGVTQPTGTRGAAAAALQVLLVPNLDASRSLAIVQLEYIDSANGINQTQNYRIDNSMVSETFKVLLTDPAKRTYRYRIQLLATAAAPAWDSGWQESSDSVLMIPGAGAPPATPATPANPAVPVPTPPSG